MSHAAAETHDFFPICLSEFDVEEDRDVATPHFPHVSPQGSPKADSMERSVSSAANAGKPQRTHSNRVDSLEHYSQFELSKLKHPTSSPVLERDICNPVEGMEGP